ncbi:MAG: ATP phosphoribosyltransferase [Chloroflexi bacterium]|nr:ATP phosphoribosyltransferase [Chloroflexota bacterium]
MATPSRASRSDRRRSALIWLALPDGHNQGRAAAFLAQAGLRAQGYAEGAPADRPCLELEGVACKVIRPQDMPVHVANGNFDLAVTGQDWLADHRCQFPNSPVIEALTIRVGQVMNIGAIVAKATPAARIEELADYLSRGGLRRPFLRVASEYVHLADEYCRRHHLGRFRIIPTWGKTEALPPQDADMIVENWEGGTTLEANDLKVLDPFLQSWPCLIVHRQALVGRGERARRVRDVIARLSRAPCASAPSPDPARAAL